MDISSKNVQIENPKFFSAQLQYTAREIVVINSLIKSLQFMHIRLLKLLTVVFFAESRRMKSFRWTAHAIVALALVYISSSLFSVHLKSFEIDSKIGKFLVQLFILLSSLSFDLHMRFFYGLCERKF